LHRRRRTALVLSAAIAAAAPFLTACGSDAHPGAAAVVGGQRITVTQLQNRVNEVRRAQRAAVPDETQYQQVLAATSNLTRNTLYNMVLDRVVHRAAQDAGISATRKEVEEMRTGLEQQNGGSNALQLSWLQKYYIAPKRLDDNLRFQVEANKLAQLLGTDTSQPAFWTVLAKASAELHVDLNPRYGAWDVQKSSGADARTPWVREVTSAGTQATA
jgi:hypothetical protein